MHRLDEALDLFEHAIYCGSLSSDLLLLDLKLLLDLLKHELCRGSLSSDLLLLEMKLHLHLDVGIWLSAATLAPCVDSLGVPDATAELRERI